MPRTKLRVDASSPTKICELKPAPYNPRTITPRAKAALQRSLDRWGDISGIVLNALSGNLVAGHQRVAVLIEEHGAELEIVWHDEEWGEIVVPTGQRYRIRRVQMSDAEERLANLSANSEELTGDWTAGAMDVAAEIRAAIDDPDLLDALRLDPLLDSIEKLFSGAEGVGGGGDAEPQIERRHELARELGVERGQIWQLGDHRIACGDCTTDRALLEALMQGAPAQICWTDPPWNVAYGTGSHPTYKKRTIANDNLGAAFPDFCRAFCGAIAAHVAPGAPLYVAMSAQEWPVIHAALLELGFHWSSTIIWAKDRLVLSRKDYHTQYEPIWYGWRDGAARLHSVIDRAQSDLWTIPRPSRSDEHPTMKPIELVARSLVNSSRKGDVVFEPFSGSGTTIIASEQSGRRCRAVELEPGYVAVAIQRWRDATGKKPRLVQSPTAS